MKIFQKLNDMLAEKEKIQNLFEKLYHYYSGKNFC